MYAIGGDRGRLAAIGGDPPPICPYVRAFYTNFSLVSWIPGFWILGFLELLHDVVPYGSCTGVSMAVEKCNYRCLQKTLGLLCIFDGFSPLAVAGGSKEGVFEGSRGSLLRCLGRFSGVRCFGLFKAIDALSKKAGVPGVSQRVFSRAPEGPFFGV